ncbi:LacI family DNA-binding transcriptional regulator [Rahnella sikkimica]|uniref:LacI family transcriptional regulator n=1 Tax=Rahnella sikkimica TaxID=1805933 RepID=A0A2L1UTZ7_9GAMM|nr:LacI family DNA-binding transcriptional regulator [Rahnella sikkimica]AVF36442.1 LacI family transcriptional regulator [Rahnella sikkimica]
MSKKQEPGAAVRATIRDVASAAKTGKTSVSRYLNGEKDLLSDALKERIGRAIALLDYQPSQMARSLKSGQTRLIGLIIADITNPYSVEVMRGVEAACRQEGLTLLVCNTNNELDQEKHYLQLLSSYRVDGIVVNAVGMREAAISTLQQANLPMVLIDRKVANFACDVIGLNNVEATQMMTDHLLQQGFEALLFISEPATINTRLERLRTFLQRMQQSPQHIAEQCEIEISNTEALENMLREFIARHSDKRKAVMCVNGTLTLQVARAMRRLGIVWGQDIGLSGFDELAWAELAGVGITTLKQPTYEMGVAALSQLVARIQGNTDPVKDLEFSGELIARGSTAAR